MVLYLLHPRENRILHTVSSLNGQIRFGGDVISRINTVYEDFGNPTQLQDSIVDTLNQLIGRMTEETGVDRNCITKLCVAGNTTMERLLLGEDPRGLAEAPLRPHSLRPRPGLPRILGCHFLNGPWFG